VFRVKVCGITNIKDAEAALEAGAEAIGLNFYPPSPRYLGPDLARALVDALPAGIVKVGLFVNSTADGVLPAARLLHLDFVQLHGDELPEHLIALETVPVIKAFRVGPAGLRPVLEYLQRCRRLDCLPALVLLDAFRPGQYGGTGQALDWSILRDYPSEEWHPPMVLAGGLTPANVGEAIRLVRPSAVDVASGVESSPGRKDRAAMSDFIRAALAAFT